MATTPLLRTPQVDGGSLYTFSSSARDLTRTRGDENLKLVFSKFVLLNLPDFDRLDFNSFSSYQNYMQFDTIDGMIANGGLKADPNVNWVESLQNYAFNLEELILSDTDYDNTTNKSVAERVFFKWLKETGAIRFRTATTQERSGSVTTPRFVEEDEITTGSEQYRRVVKYVGDIDMINSVNKAGESYTEIYINVPTEAGNTPTILFEALEDNNYQSGLKIQGESEFILGRNSSSSHPQGLDMVAFYDYDQPLLGGGPAGYTDPDANWMDEPTPPNTTDTYFTEPTTFIDPTNDDIRKYPADYGSPAGFSGVAYRRSRLDGISVDFNPNDYQQIVNDPEVSTIQEFNGSDLSGNFEFNAVLIYYDLVDLSNSDNTVTNLYGILLLDNITPTTDGGYVQRVPKFKPNPVTGQNGNSYGFKANLRFDVSAGSAGIDTIVNDYNTFSMGLFVDAVAQLQESAKIFQGQQQRISELEQHVQELQNVIGSVSQLTFLQSQIDSLQNQIDNASLAFADGANLLDLISANADEIQNLAQGDVSVNLQYNTDVLAQGPGITLDKTTPNKVKIELKAQEYALMEPFDEDGVSITDAAPININVATPKIYADLQPYTNMLRMYTQNTAGGDLLIYIDDSAIQFKTGQTVRIVFNNLSIGSKNIKIFTDSLNRLNQGEYGVQIAEISNSDITSKCIIEAVCLEQGTLKFAADVLK